MVTFNISLPEQLASIVDREVSSGSFVSRSEFFRTLLRFYKTMIAKKTTSFELVEFKKRPLTEIEEGFMATGKYSKKFIKSMISGLRRSSVYAN